MGDLRKMDAQIVGCYRLGFRTIKPGRSYAAEPAAADPHNILIFQCNKAKPDSALEQP
jgi:hypothetical protein